MQETVLLLLLLFNKLYFCFIIRASDRGVLLTNCNRLSKICNKCDIIRTSHEEEVPNAGENLSFHSPSSIVAGVDEY